jgi:RsiW-degrading membrane proteinase PrsW (M82 family)
MKEGVEKNLRKLIELFSLETRDISIPGQQFRNDEIQSNSGNKLSKDEFPYKNALVNQITQAILLIKNKMKLFTQFDRVNSILIPPLIPLCYVVKMEIVGNNKIILENKNNNKQK